MENFLVVAGRHQRDRVFCTAEMAVTQNEKRVLVRVGWTPDPFKAHKWDFDYDGTKDSQGAMGELTDPMEYMHLLRNKILAEGSPVDVTTLEILEVKLEIKPCVYIQDALNQLREHALSKLTQEEKAALDLIKYDVFVKTAKD